MPAEINGQLYYRTAEIYRSLGISRNTLFRWLRKDVLGDIERRDIRGWRLFTPNEINILKKSINQVVETERPKGKRSL